LKEIFKNIFKVFIILFLSLLCFAFIEKALSAALGSNEIGKEKEVPVKSPRNFGCNGPFIHNEYECDNHCKASGVSNQSMGLDFVSSISYKKIKIKICYNLSSLVAILVH
jgi:hypothetical protein